MSARNTSFKIHGMDCAEEIAILKREVGPLVGGEANLAFDLLNAKMIVSEGSAASSEAILVAVGNTGMKAEPWLEVAPNSRDQKSGRQKLQLLLMEASGGLTALAFLLHAWHAGGIGAALGSESGGHAHAVPWLAQGVYLAGIFSACWFIVPKAWHSARSLRPDMNFLMLVAVCGAIAIGEWFEAASVAFLFALSNALEAWSISRARRAVETLMDLTPPTAHLVVGDAVKDVPAAELAIGSRFVVKPGERIPLDGRVVQGESAVNQAPITGESLPLGKQAGDEVFAGSINGDGTLTVEGTKPANDTVLARIIRLIGEAHNKRAPSEQWVDRFARTYTPVVMGLALLVALVPLVSGALWMPWIYRALVLLVIACPCALVISTPVSIVAGLASAARHGVLVKGGMYLEAAAHLKAIAFDKTGTLTEGRPRVMEAIPLGSASEEELLRVAGALESQSGHPLAHVIVAHVRSRGIAFPAAQAFQALQGKGAMGTVDGHSYWLGSHRHLEERGLETPEIHALLKAQEAQGRTLVAFGTDGALMGFLALADAVRPETPETLRHLREAGVGHLVMLTGDNRGTAEVVAAHAGIAEFQSGLLPEDKVRAIEVLVATHGQVAMVGDGVNDAPAMARATLGIAMGAMGSDAAIETADIALMKDDLTRLPWLLAHSRRTLAVIRQNITFALAVKGVFVILTFAGHASLWSAIVADMGASLLVIVNGLRLLRN
jgi:Cd2+/Zn2+-exporting ATPase